jgi:nickel-type superoxide dismutase maturation protease
VIPSFLQKIALFLPIYKYHIIGASMFPTYKDGDSVLVNRFSYIFHSPKRGDIVAVKDPRDSKTLIKRIEKIDGNKFFVIGDNKMHSTDSREFGMIGKQNIIGKVI